MSFVHSLEPGETPSYTATHQAPNCTKFLNNAKTDEIMLKNQFSGTAMQLQRNRKFCQFNNDQYCTLITMSNPSTWLLV